MPLEKQVCSVELSKRLKDLCVNQDSLYRWQNPFNDDYWEPTSLKKEYIEKNNINPDNYSAFTAAELGEKLPSIIYPQTASGSDRVLFMTKDEEIFHIGYRNVDNNMMSYFSSGLTEADARAKMLIYLIENGKVKL